MKLRVLIASFTWLLFSGTAFSQVPDLIEYDYGDIGLFFSVPDTWTHNGVMTKTKAEFIKQFGWNYTKPDAGDLWHAFGSFISVEVDSSLIPSDSAYSIHKLTIAVERSPTWLKQWLCRIGKRFLWDDRGPEGRDVEIVSEKSIDQKYFQSGLLEEFGKEYWLSTRQTNLTTLGRVISFVHQERCYEIKMESTSANLAKAAHLHEQIMGTMKLMAH